MCGCIALGTTEAGTGGGGGPEGKLLRTSTICTITVLWSESTAGDGGQAVSRF